MKILMKIILISGIYMTSVGGATTIAFRTAEELAQALPCSVEEFTDRRDAALAKNPSLPRIEFKIDHSLPERTTIHLRHSIDNPFAHLIGQIGRLEVYYYGHLVRNHLVIAFPSEVDGIALSESDNQELFALVRNISAILKNRFKTSSFAILHNDELMQGRHVVEIVPQWPGFGEAKNDLLMVARNTHGLFPHANLSLLATGITESEMEEDVKIWREAFKTQLPEEQFPEVHLTELPSVRKEVLENECGAFLAQQFCELLYDKGGEFETGPLGSRPIRMPTEAPPTVKRVPITKRFLHTPEVISKQLIFEYGDGDNKVFLLYNLRQYQHLGPNRLGHAYLIVPSTLIERVEDLSSELLNNIRIVTAAWERVMKDLFPEGKACTYVQNGTAVGQTDLQFHVQGVVTTDDTPIAWTLGGIYPPLSGVSEEEMKSARDLLGTKMEEAIQQIFAAEEARSMEA